jgi:hypothetical protein
MDEGQTIDEMISDSNAVGDSSSEQDEERSPIEEVRDELGIGEGVDPLAALLDTDDVAPTDRVFIRRLNAWFTIEAITDDKVYDRMTDRCTHYVKGRRGTGRQKELDTRRLGKLTVAEYTISPPFTRKRGAAEFDQLAEKYGTSEPEDIVGKALYIGEIDLLVDKIMTLSGFDDEIEVAGN